MRVGVVGCGHGELEKMYGVLGRLEAAGNFHVDVLLICGDFEAVRNTEDLNSMAVPLKYRHMADFHKYYNGDLKAPVLTIIIGGNHEASSYMNELRYGGWLAPNIYYLGTAGCVRVGDLRIAGISGIYKSHDYMRGRFESVPFTDSTIRSVYHLRALDVHRLLALEKVDIMMSHDWPTGITDFGDKEWLLRTKPFFKKDIDEGQLGSPPTRKILDRLRPKYFFSAHLHVRFAALVPHDDGSETRFLALDKCLPQRNFLQVLDIPGESGPLRYDAEWLCILKKSIRFESSSSTVLYNIPTEDDLRVTREEIQDLIEEWMSDLRVPDNFEQTAPAYDPNTPQGKLEEISNPQTTSLLEKILRGAASDSPESEKISLSDFVGTQGTSETDAKEDDDAQADKAQSEDGKPAEYAEEPTQLAHQTPTGKTIKRRNANIYS